MAWNNSATDPDLRVDHIHNYTFNVSSAADLNWRRSRDRDNGWSDVRICWQQHISQQMLGVKSCYAGQAARLRQRKQTCKCLFH